MVAVAERPEPLVRLATGKNSVPVSKVVEVGVMISLAVRKPGRRRRRIFTGGGER